MASVHLVLGGVITSQRPCFVGFVRHVVEKRGKIKIALHLIQFIRDFINLSHCFKENIFDLYF